VDNCFMLLNLLVEGKLSRSGGGTMKFAYLVCLVALLQVSTCLPTGETTDTSTDTSTESSTSLTVATEIEANDTVSAETTTMDGSTDTETTSDSTESVEVESLKYTNATETETSSTVQEESSSTTTASPGHAALVHPTALAIIVPLCIRLFSMKLVGGV